jgi:hypothetical protein
MGLIVVANFLLGHLDPVLKLLLDQIGDENILLGRTNFLFEISAYRSSRVSLAPLTVAITGSFFSPHAPRRRQTSTRPDQRSFVFGNVTGP